MAADAIVERIRKKFGAGAASVPGARTRVRRVIPCGIDVVDRHIMGVGGAVRGGVTEIYSEFGVAKTTFLWTQLGGVQRQPEGLAIYADLEGSLDPVRPAVFGLDQNNLVLMEPFTLEEALDRTHETAELLPDNGPPTIIALDSLAGGAGDVDMSDKSYSDPARDDRAAKIGSWIRAMNALAIKKQFHLLLINQTRQKRGVIFGDKTTTPGGDGPKFFASLRIQMFGGKALKDKTGRHVGKAVTFFVTKSRYSEPFRKAKVRLDYTQGWDNLWTTISHAKDRGLVSDGAKYTEDTYHFAVKQLGWENAAPVRVAASTDADVDGGDVDDVELAEFAGEPLDGGA